MKEDFTVKMLIIIFILLPFQIEKETVVQEKKEDAKDDAENDAKDDAENDAENDEAEEEEEKEELVVQPEVKILKKANNLPVFG